MGFQFLALADASLANRCVLSTQSYPVTDALNFCPLKKLRYINPFYGTCRKWSCNLRSQDENTMAQHPLGSSGQQSSKLKALYSTLKETSIETALHLLYRTQKIHRSGKRCQLEYPSFGTWMRIRWLRLEATRVGRRFSFQRIPPKRFFI